MSFGWSGSDVFLLAQLAWNTVQHSRKACGEYDELTREALRLHAVLQRLEQEVAKPESPINRYGENSKEQLERIATDCEVVLKQLDKIVTAYAALSEEKRSARKIWQKVRFGNGQMADLGDLRSKLMLYTSEMLLYLNFVSMSTVGRIEQRMDRDGGVLRDIKIAVEKKTAHTVLCGGNREGSILTAYANDDTGFWKGLRRDLIKDGLPSAVIQKHKHLIKKYVKELGARGILDDDTSKENDQQRHDIHADDKIAEEIQELPNSGNVNLNVPEINDHNVEIQPSADVNEQSFGDSLNKTIAEDIESESPDVDSRATFSQNMKEQLRNTTDDVGIGSEAKSKPQTDFHKSDPLEPVYSESRPRKIPSKKSVPFRPANKRLWTSEKEMKTGRNDAAGPGDPESAAQIYATSHASSHDGFFPRSIAELQREIKFVVTPAGLCHKSNMSLLYKDFGQRINVMLECLPDRSLESPQTVPGDDPYYAADVEVILSLAHSAQNIIRDISDFKHRPGTTLIDFRPEDFIDTLDIREHYKVPQGLYVRIHELIATFDRQCCDAVDRIRQWSTWKSSAYPRHTMPSKPPPMHKDAHVNFSSQQHSEPTARRGASTADRTPKTSDFKAWESMRTPRHSQPPLPFQRRTEPSKAAGPPPVLPGRETNGKAPAYEIGGGMPSGRSFHFSTNKGGGGFNGSDAEDIFASFFKGSDVGDKDHFFSQSFPQFKSSKNKTVDANGNRNSDSSYSSRKEPQRSATYQPSPEIKQPSIRRSEMMPVDRMRPRNPAPLKSSNLKHMKAPSDTSDSSSELDSDTMEETYPPPRPTPRQRKPTSGITQEGTYSMEPEAFQSRRTESRRAPERPSAGSGPGLGLFGEYEPYDNTEKTFRNSPKHSEDDEPHLITPDDDPRPHIEGVPIRSNGHSPAASSRHSQGSSPLDKINDIIHKFQTEYEPQCKQFLNGPPADANERKKLYDKLSEIILQHVLLEIDAVNAEDEVLRGEKKQLIIDAQFALEQLDQVMGAD